MDRETKDLIHEIIAGIDEQLEDASGVEEKVLLLAMRHQVVNITDSKANATTLARIVGELGSLRGQASQRALMTAFVGAMADGNREQLQASTTVEVLPHG